MDAAARPGVPLRNLTGTKSNAKTVPDYGRPAPFAVAAFCAKLVSDLVSEHLFAIILAAGLHHVKQSRKKPEKEQNCAAAARRASRIAGARVARA
jgi:hypothetical protein